jgi:hypothetical protein
MTLPTQSNLGPATKGIDLLGKSKTGNLTAELRAIDWAKEWERLCATRGY